MTTLAAYTLKSIAALNSNITDLEDKNTGLSFLFYSLVQGNILNFKGEKADTLKRLVGSKLFPLVPMARFKKTGETKAVYQFTRRGASATSMMLDELGFASIPAMLDIEADRSVDYYPEFAAKVETWLAAQDEQRKAESKLKADETKSVKDTETQAESQAVADKLAKFERAQVANPSMTLEQFETRITAVEKRMQAIEILRSIGDDVATLISANEAAMAELNLA